VVAATVAVAVLLAGGALATVGLAAAARVDQKSAEARLAEVERLADGTEMWARLAEVEALAPVAPGLVAEAEAWQARTLEVVERLPLHRAFADSLEALGRPEGAQADTARARLEQWERVLAAVQAREPDPEVARRLDSVRSALAGLPPPGPTRWLFEDEETAWLHASSRQVLAAGERLLDPDPFAGGIADVERRRRISAELAALADTREWRAAWRAARERIVRSQVYGGLELPVQDGLVPLGPDPRTGLEEFWHVPSGTRPRPADAGPGRWAMDGRSGIVFILVPGGSFTMGAQSEDPGGLHHDPRAPPSAAPVHEVRLDPYFISRYELSRGQRLRLAGVDPDPMEQGDATDPLAYPTDRLSLERAVEVFARYGLTVPTEAQWETAARAGSTGPHPWQGEDFSGWANLADARFEGEATVRGRPFAAGIDDGWAGLAPVGRQRPNAWGVHDVMGNLMEVVRGGWFRYPDGPEGHREGDGLIPLRPGVPAVARGGNFTSLPTAVRLSTRSPIEPSVAEREIGVRAARPVRP
jgi:formylglycine-generating enzyme required for sulfatase activity